MKEWVARLFEEKRELEERVNKLDAFLKVQKIPLTEKQRELMTKQLDAMRNYLDILVERIELESEMSKKNKEI